MASPIIMEILLLGEEGKCWLEEMTGTKMRCRHWRDFFSPKNWLGDARAFPLIEEILSDTMPRLPFCKARTFNGDQRCAVQDPWLSPPPYRQPGGNGDKATSKDKRLPGPATPAARETVWTAALGLGPFAWSKLALPFLMFSGSKSCRAE